MSSGEANVTIEVRLNEGGATGQIVIRGRFPPFGLDWVWAEEGRYRDWDE